MLGDILNSVDEFVYRNIRCFPELFPNRVSVLHHVLCVAGTEYYWGEDGNVHRDGGYRPEWSYDAELDRLVKFRVRFFGSEANLETLSDSLLAELNKSKDVFENARWVSTVRGGGIKGGQVYPQSESALLMNIPVNVSDDWREACEEMKAEVVNRGWVF